VIIGSYEQAIEKMKRDISVDRRLKARVKSIEKILENNSRFGPCLDLLN
jgi:hypothetical protein